MDKELLEMAKIIEEAQKNKNTSRRPKWEEEAIIWEHVANKKDDGNKDDGNKDEKR